MNYVTLGVSIILLPCIYWVVMKLYQPSKIGGEFQEKDPPQEEENPHGEREFPTGGKKQGQRPMQTVPEFLVLLVAECALVRLWFARGCCTFSDLTFQLLFVMLAAMTVFCMMDYWEHIVPNRILLVLLFIFLILLGYQGMKDISVLLMFFPSMLLGLVFCMISFGLGYLLSHKSMGAGDVKLALVMGLYLTSDYVVGAVLYGCLAGALFSIVQMLRGRISRKDLIPFVPFLYIGLIISYLVHS